MEWETRRQGEGEGGTVMVGLLTGNPPGCSPLPGGLAGSVEPRQPTADAFSVGVLDGFEDGQGLAPQTAGAVQVALLFRQQAHVCQLIALPAPVAMWLLMVSAD